MIVWQTNAIKTTVQQLFKGKSYMFDTMEQNCKRLVQVANIMDIPLIVTEQVPDKFGSTLPFK